MYLTGKILEIRENFVKTDCGYIRNKARLTKGIIYITSKIENLTDIIYAGEIDLKEILSEEASGIYTGHSIPPNTKAGLILTDDKEDLERMELHNKKGISLYKKGNFLEAKKEFLISSECFSHLPYSYNNLASVLCKKGLFDEAINFYNKAIELKPDYGQPWVNMGKVYEILGDMGLAVEYLHRGLELDPEDVSSHYKGMELEIEDKEEEEKLLRKKAMEYFEKGMAEFENNLIEKAIEKWKKALEFHSEFYEVHLNLGTAFKELDQLEEAKNHYIKAVEINSSDFLAHYNLGLIYYQEEDFPSACEEYREALFLNPHDMETKYNFAMALYKMKKYKESEEELKNILKINPSFGEAYYSLGLIYDEKEMFNSACSNYQRAINIMPGHAPSHYELAIVYCKKRSFEFAISEFQKALELEPENYRAVHKNMGLIYEEMKQSDRAWKEYELALRYDPSDIQSRFRLGVLMFNEGLYEDAMDSLEEVLKMNPVEEMYELALDYIVKIEDILEEEIEKKIWEEEGEEIDKETESEESAPEKPEEIREEET